MLQEAEEIITLLNENYAANRDVDKDLGGYILILQFIIKCKLENTNSFQFYHELQEVIEKLEYRICKKVEQTRFYRARIGFKYVLKDWQDPVFIKDTEFVIPYKDEEIMLQNLN